jgi:non-ribosomal peptide synthetase component F
LFDLTSAQLAIWHAQMLAPDNPVYNIAECLELDGEVDLDLLAASISRAVVEAESIRMRFCERDGVPKQYVEEHEPEIEVFDLTAESRTADPETVARAWMRSETLRPRPLTERLYSVALFRVGPRRVLWYQSCHHIAVDGYGGSLISTRAAQIYTALRAGRDPSAEAFEPVSVLMDADRAYLGSAERAADRAYWSATLADLRPRLAVELFDPSGPQVAPVPPFRHRHPRRLTPDVAARYRDAAWRLRTNLSVLAIAAAAVYRHRTTGERDVVIGVPVRSRTAKRELAIPGNSANVLPLRLSLDAYTTVAELLSQIAGSVRRGLRHQRYRHEEVLRDLKLVGGRPLCAISVNVMPFEYALPFDDVAARVHNICVGPSEDVRIDLYDHSGAMALDVDVNPDLHDARETARIIRHYLRVLDWLAAAGPEEAVRDVRLLDELELARVTARPPYVLDQYLAPVPVGVAGDLYLAGSDQKADTAGPRPAADGAPRSVADPFAAAGSRIHRTGVRAVWEAPGRLRRLEPAPEPDPVVADAPPAERVEFVRALYAEALELAVEAVADDGNFFLLGGYSLLAVQVVGRIRAELGVELPVRTLFETPTVAGLAGRLAEGESARPPLTAGPRPERIPLSYAQRRLWFVSSLEGPSATYNSPIALRLTGTLDQAALAAALRDVVGRHEALRTVVTIGGDGEPVQRVLAADALAWELDVVPVTGLAPDATLADLGLTDIDDLPWDRGVLPVDPAAPGAVPADRSEPETEPGPPAGVDARSLAAAVTACAAHAFDLATEIPIKARLFASDRGEHVLVLVVHHIASDGWSLGVLAEDVSTAYVARQAGRAPRWAALPVQYADYALWQRALLGDGSDPDSLMARQTAHWRAVLAGAPEELALPFDRPRPPTSSHRGHTAVFGVPPRVHAGLADLAREEGVTVFMVLQAALAVLLSRLGAGPDVPIGSAHAGRTDVALDRLIGCFVNTLVLRADLSGDPTFRGLLARVREAALAGLAHQDVPFEQLVEQFAPRRSLARQPLFQVVLTMLNSSTVARESPSPVLDLPGVACRELFLGRPTAKFDLDVMIGETFDTAGAPNGVRGAVTVAADLFGPAAAERIARCWLRLLDALTDAPGERLSSVDLLDPQERHRILRTWNDTGSRLPGPPGESSVLARFEARARLSPEAVAVVEDGHAVGYAELDARADRLAGLLRESGVRPESVVALALPRGLETIAGMLAVWKAGGAYLPIDQGLPADRVGLMLADSRAVLVLGPSATLDELPAGRIRMLALDAPRIAARLAAPTPPVAAGSAASPAAALPDGLAYVIYTSGSTGRPKGVGVTHAALANYVHAITDVEH